MPSMSAANRLFIRIAVVLVALACTAQKEQLAESDDSHSKIIAAADRYLEQGQFRDVEKILDAYLNKYPGSAYSDDAAYRLAYLHVVADSDNPYFDYNAARIKFGKFKEDFPDSRYVYACNNWLKVLNLIRGSKLNRPPDVVQQAGDCDRLKEELMRQQEENKKLQAVLKDLEAALER